MNAARKAGRQSPSGHSQCGLSRSNREGKGWVRSSYATASPSTTDPADKGAAGDPCRGQKRPNNQATFDRHEQAWKRAVKIQEPASRPPCPMCVLSHVMSSEAYSESFIFPQSCRGRFHTQKFCSFRQRLACSEQRQPTGLTFKDELNDKLRKQSPAVLLDVKIVAKRFLKRRWPQAPHHCNCSTSRAGLCLRCGMRGG